MTDLICLNCGEEFEGDETHPLCPFCGANSNITTIDEYYEEQAMHQFGLEDDFANPSFEGMDEEEGEEDET